VAATLALLCTAASALDTRRDDVEQFIARVARQDGLSRHAVRKLLKSAHSEPAILEAMDRPAEKARPWYEYRPLFLTEKRIQAGADFWSAHRAELDQASLDTGVPAEYMVAILGVETFYGRLTGRYRVIDALATLAFDYPPRAKFFQDELEQFLLLTHETSIDPLTATGSYAGAMGAPQFMPSNYRKFGVDANHDGRVDLWASWPDIFASIGSYLRGHGWNAGEPVLSEASYAPAEGDAAAGRDLALSDTVASLQARGVAFESLLPADAPVILIAADDSDAVHWRVGYQNFYAITRYNKSALYAMAVYELAQAVKRRHAEMETQSAAAPSLPPAPAATPGVSPPS
jgi:membrane-bound lytic murein transglycosylase B